MRISENLSDKDERPHLLPEAHEHLKHSDARSFWATIPYFRSQVSETFCSVAAATMVINAATRKSDEVLLFDPDTEFHQPYWAPRESLFRAMLEKDAATGGSRGYLLIRRE